MDKTGKAGDVTRWDEKAGLRRDALGSQVIDVLEAYSKHKSYIRYCKWPPKEPLSSGPSTSNRIK
jgi:hypothetical protein